MKKTSQCSEPRYIQTKFQVSQAQNEKNEMMQNLEFRWGEEEEEEESNTDFQKVMAGEAQDNKSKRKLQ